MKNREKGQAILLVVVALGIFLLGAIGLAVDGAQMYAHREMAQAAADAAAQAGIFSIFAGTLTTDGTTYTCTTTDARTPCVYARNNGFGGSADDAVTVSFPTSPYNGVTGTPNTKYPYKFEQVAITRTLHTTFMRFLGTSSATISAIGGAGIVQNSSPVPIVVLDRVGPAPSFSLSGTPNIAICGGPQRSIQVNLGASGAVSVKGSAKVDLSKAGPKDSGSCTTGTGGDFGTFGTSDQPYSGWLTPFGATEHYDQPAAPINDPLSGVVEPSAPANIGTVATIPLGSGDCPVTPPKTTIKSCTGYTSGYYASGIQVKDTIAIFQPGLYYMDGSNGFSGASNSYVTMCSTTCVQNPLDTSNCCTNNGMLIYLSKNAGPVQVGANGNASLLGSDNSSSYLGMLFFVSRSAPNQNSSLGGGGSLSLQGTVYMPTQALSLQGNSGNTTLVKGEIIANDLSLGGTGNITMQLNPSYKLPIDQVALVK